MPEYLTPGVIIEETSFRSRSIEGVATSTFGMAGLTYYGPVPYVLTAPSVVMVPKPPLVTSVTEFDRAFGGLDNVGTLPDTRNYLAHAARAFFANGGRRLYVSRVFQFLTVAGSAAIDVDRNFAKLLVGPANAPLATWRARWPGSAGNSISVAVAFRRSKNVLIGGRLTGVYPGAAVETGAANAVITDSTPPVPGNVKIVAKNAIGDLGYRGAGGFEAVNPAQAVFHITVDVTVQLGERVDVYSGLELDSDHPRAMSTVLQAERPIDEFSLVWLDVPAGAQPGPLLAALAQPPAPPPTPQFLTGGSEGGAVDANVILGLPSNPDDAKVAATGLEALGEIDDIAIVASPDSVRFSDPGLQKTAVDNLIAHCERQRYRIGIVDPPADSSISAVREFRSQFDTKYAALYYPWVQIIDPTAKNDPGAPVAKLNLPPSGFVAGIYARSDIERGVHKAPANEVVLGITQFLQNVTFDRQSVLNPEGINALRFFEGRSNRVWGARTMSSDPEWKYVNVRRLFMFLEHSIDKSTQYAVFAPNNERLWASIRQSVEDFLLFAWRTGALLGTKPEEAFFVRCDRTTMTQNDLDNGRLICLIGVAPTYPAEFVIFRIGQFTADAQQS